MQPQASSEHFESILELEEAINKWTKQTLKNKGKAKSSNAVDEIRVSTQSFFFRLSFVKKETFSQKHICTQTDRHSLRLSKRQQTKKNYKTPFKNLNQNGTFSQQLNTHIHTHF